VTVPVDVTLSSPASFFTFADSKKPTGTKKNIKSCAVAGKVTDSEGAEHEFADCSYNVAGKCSTSLRPTALGCCMTRELKSLAKRLISNVLFQANLSATGRQLRQPSVKCLSRVAK